MKSKNKTKKDMAIIKVISEVSWYMYCYDLEFDEALSIVKTRIENDN